MKQLVLDVQAPPAIAGRERVPLEADTHACSPHTHMGGGYVTWAFSPNSNGMCSIVWSLLFDYPSRTDPSEHP
jgi:hypothetical protein